MFRNWNQIDFGASTLPYMVDKGRLDDFDRANESSDNGRGPKRSQGRSAASVWNPLGVRG